MTEYLLDQNTSAPVAQRGTAGGAALAALVDSAAKVGRVGGICARIMPDAQPVLTTGSAYTSGNLCGGKLKFSGAARAGVSSGMIQSVILTAGAIQSASFDLVFFNADPAATTFSDKAVFSIAAADLSKVVGFAQLQIFAQFQAQTVWQASQLALPFVLAAGVDLWAALVTRGTPTFAAAGELGLSLRVLQD